MNEHPFKKTLRHLAEDTFPPGTDLWPEIRQQLEGAKTHKRIKMATRFSNFARAFAFDAALVLLVFGLAWMLSNTGPQPGIMPTQTLLPTQKTNSNFIATDVPLTSIPTATPISLLNYETYRDRGITKILAGDLDGGIADLIKAKSYKPLDQEAQKYFDWASAYRAGRTTWDVEWELTLNFLDEVVTEAPDLHDLSGTTAADLYKEALRMYVAELMKKGEWCKALQQHLKLVAFDPSLENDPDFQLARDELASHCSIGYHVQQGDTCASITYTYSIPMSALIGMNGLSEPCDLVVGQEILIPLLSPHPPFTPLSMSADSEMIRQHLMDSQVNWRSIYIDAVITRIDRDATYITRAQIWFVDPDKSREIYDFDNDNIADSIIFTRNVLQTTVDLNSGGESTQVLSRAITPPLSILTPGRAFAMQRMQSSGGKFLPIGAGTVAGRETLIVEWSDDTGQPKDRIWIDVYTGVVLKWQNLREGFKGANDGQEDLMDAEIEVLEVTYDGMISDNLFTPNVPDEPIYMDYSDVTIEIPEGNLDITALQSQLNFPLLIPATIPENYTFSGWYFTVGEVPATLEFDCGRGTPDWWGFVILITPYSEGNLSSHLLRSFVGQDGQIESVMIGGIEGEYLQGDWVEQFDPVTLKANRKEWNIDLNTHHLLWVQDGILYWIHTSRASTDLDYAGPCRIDKEDLLAFAESLQ